MNRSKKLTGKKLSMMLFNQLSSKVSHMPINHFINHTHTHNKIDF